MCRTASPAKRWCAGRACSAATGARTRSTPRCFAAAGSTWATCSGAIRDGTLDFVDRRKYLIKSGGENIYPAEIERVLLASPQIETAVVVRRPDAQWGEVPVAFVVARSDRSSRAEEWSRCAAGNIAGYKVPKDVRFVADEDIPRSTSGKVKRHELESRLVGERI